MTLLTKEEAAQAVELEMSFLEMLWMDASMMPDYHFIVALLDGDGSYDALYESPSHPDFPRRPHDAKLLADHRAGTTSESWRYADLVRFRRVTKGTADVTVEGRIMVVCAAEPIEVATMLSRKVAANSFLLQYRRFNAGRYTEAIAMQAAEEEAIALADH